MRVYLAEQSAIDFKVIPLFWVINSDTMYFAQLYALRTLCSILVGMYKMTIGKSAEFIRVKGLNEKVNHVLILVVFDLPFLKLNFLIDYKSLFHLLWYDPLIPA